jgi:uncharacterized protein YndB with AHSA1/START domain
MSTATNTIRLHRVLRAPPERVYRAFLEAEGPPNGFTGQFAGRTSGALRPPISEGGLARLRHKLRV